MSRLSVKTRAVALGLAGSLAVAGAARAAIYVDQSLPDLKPEERAVVANPQPVQLLFQFKTKGAANARATKIVKPKVVEAVKASGLFTDVSDSPQPNGAILNISIDDTGDTGAAARSGFVTGLTFGLKGSVVADNYEAVADYVATPSAAKLTKVAHHRLITIIGLAEAPPNLEKAKNTEEAVFTMVRQVVSHDLNDLAKDPAFGPPATAAAAVTTAPAASAAPVADAPPVPPTAAPQPAPAAVQ